MKKYIAGTSHPLQLTQHQVSRLYGHTGARRVMHQRFYPRDTEQPCYANQQQTHLKYECVSNTYLRRIYFILFIVLGNK
jgi:hypothetical protein